MKIKEKPFPLVSFIIPVFNTEKFLTDCLNSVFGQTYQNIEVIIINDCSTDRSLEIINNFRQKYNNIIFINHKQNQGLSESRNAGIEACHGDYLSFVDSDDMIDINFINYLLPKMIATNSDIGIPSFITFETDVSFKDKDKNNNECDRIIHQDTIWDITSEEDLIKKTISAGKIYRKDLFKTCRFKKGKIHEDEYIFHHIYCQINNVLITNKVLYFYRINSSSIMHNETIDSFADKIYSICERICFIRKSHILNKKNIILYYLKMLTGYPIYGTFTICTNISHYYKKALRKLGKEFWFISKKYWNGKLWFWRLMLIFPHVCYQYYKKRYYRSLNHG